MASLKRESSDVGFPEAKRAKATGQSERVPVVLNPADCNLDFNIHDGGIYGDALYDEGFAYCWSGARANVGITGGKYCFGCKIICNQPVIMQDTPLDQQNVCRIGISRGDDSVGNLGETPHSYGFGGTGKFSNAGKFSDYGERFGVGDTIICAVDLESKPNASLGFSKNGQWLGIAKQIDAKTLLSKQKDALFPHILLKNVGVQMQFSIEDGLVPIEGYKPWAEAFLDENALVGPSFSDPKRCEVMMMVGLPASGKSTWAEKWVKEHPEKRYVLLGTNLALDQMKVPGLLRKHNYSARFELLMDRATKIFNTLLSRAAKTPRNYIIDQTNVYKSARKRKLKQFAMYQKIAVVIFPEPKQLKMRSQKRMEEMGKEVPAEAVNEMIANFTLPMSKDMPGANEYFDVVIFPELNRDESRRCLDEMKRALSSSAANDRDENQSSFSRESYYRSTAGNYPGGLAGPQRVNSFSLVQGGSLQEFSRSQPPSYGYQHSHQIPASELSPPIHSGRLEPPPVVHRATTGAPYQGFYSNYGSGFAPRHHDHGSHIANHITGTEPDERYRVGASMMNPATVRSEFQPPRPPAFEQPPLMGPYGLPYEPRSSGPYDSRSWNGSNVGRSPRPRYY